MSWLSEWGHWNLARLALIAIGVSSAFTIGVLVQLGLELLPLIDKGHLLVLLAFYGASVALLVSLSRLIFEYSTPVTLPVGGLYNQLLGRWQAWRRGSRAGRRHGRRLARRYTHAKRDTVFSKPIGIRTDEAVAGAVGQWLVFAFFLFVGLHLTLDVFRHLPTPFPPSRAGLTSLLMMMLFLGVFWLTFRVRGPIRSSGGTRTLARVRTILVSLAVLVGAFGAGAVWVDYLRWSGPQVQIVWSGTTTPTAATLVMTAIDGVVLFEGRGQPSPVYVPWSQISRISREAPPRSNGT